MDENEVADAWDREIDSPDFAHGVDLGKSLGWYDAYVSAKRAFDAGEINLWLEWQEPKSLTDWLEWEAAYGKSSEFEKRWTSED